MYSRRHFIGSAAVLAGASAVSGRVQAASIPEAVTSNSPAMQPPLFPSSGPDYQPVVTLNGWTLPWRMNGDWKEFHLVAEPVVREGLGANDYKDPGWFKHPAGTVAFLHEGGKATMGDPPQAPAQAGKGGGPRPGPEIELRAVKPGPGRHGQH